MRCLVPLAVFRNVLEHRIVEVIIVLEAANGLGCRYLWTLEFVACIFHTSVWGHALGYHEKRGSGCALRIACDCVRRVTQL